MSIGAVAQSAVTTIFHTTKGFLNFALLAVTKGAMHGMAQGIIQGVSGGDPGQSFLTAMATSIVGDIFGADFNGKGNGLGWAGSVRGSVVGHSLFGGVVGGVVSNMQGGNFWEGAAIGLTVGLLNHASKPLSKAIDGWLSTNPNPKGKYEPGIFKKMQKEFSQLKSNIDMDKVSNILGGLGLGTDAKMAIISLAKGELTAISGYLKGMNILGGALGFGAIGLAARSYLNSPTTANLLGLVGTTATVVFAGPVGSFAVGLADATGASNWAYGQLGNMIDNMAGYSVGNALYGNISGLFNLKLAKP